MALFESFPSLAIAVIIIALNVLAAIFRGRLSFALTAVSILIHVAIAPVMLFALCPLSELALVYSVSLFAYLLPIYIMKKKGEKDDL